jgi:hypothetical protein
MAGGEIQQSLEKRRMKTAMATEMTTVTARILTLMPTPMTAHQQQQ